MFRLSGRARIPRGGSRSWSRSYASARPSVFTRSWRLLKWTTGFATAASIAYIGTVVYATNNPPQQLPRPSDRKRLVILGTGWGSVSLLKGLDTSNYDVTIVSPRNYFMFTPLLTSCSTGNIEHRSIMEPIRHVMRYKQAQSTFIEGEAEAIDATSKTVRVKSSDSSDTQDLKYDVLVVGVGSEVSTYGIPGVQEYGCYMKEIDDAQKTRKRIMDSIEAASFPGIDEKTRKRLLHTVVVGGGPTGVEFAGELHDFFEEDMRRLLPEMAKDFKVTLVEALPNVLASFSKHLINYTEKHLKDEKIMLMTKTAVKKVTEDSIIAERTLPDGTKEQITLPYGTFVWCGGNMPRTVVRNLMNSIPAQGASGARRGLVVDDFLAVKGAEDVYALGDCAQSHFAPTAQVAAQQGSYLAGCLNHSARFDDAAAKVAHLEREAPSEEVERELKAAHRSLRRIAPNKAFEYSHQGSLAYIGSEQAVADLNLLGGTEFASGGRMTYLFWRSAYLSMCFSFRNKVLVAFDWMKVKIFGRDVSRE